MNLRAASENKKNAQKHTFRSKASREVDRMQTKDDKHSKSIVKISDKSSSTSISAHFDVCENGQDVLDFVVETCLSEQSQHAIGQGLLELELLCRDPTPRSSGTAENIRMASTSCLSPTTTVAKTTTTNNTSTGTKLNGDQMSLLEWNVVPRGRVWLTVYELDVAGGTRTKSKFPLHMTEAFQSYLLEDLRE